MKKIIAILAILAPSMAFAQSSLAPITDVNSLSSRILGIGNTFTYLLVAAAVIFIVWNVVVYLIKSDDAEGKGAAGLKILYGLIGLFVIVSIWGLVAILTNTFKTTPTTQAIPNFGTNPSTGGIPSNTVPQVQ